MAEIFFIASDERALDLIESLRIQSPKSLTFETDLPSAIRRLPKEQPRYVFIQSELDGIPAEEIASQTRALVADPAVQLILLEEGESPGEPAIGFDYSLSLALPTARLSGEVMQLLSSEVISGLTATPPSDFSDLSSLADLPDLFVLDDTPEFEVPDLDDAAFEPHLAPLWPEQPDRDPQSVMETEMPLSAAEELATFPAEEIGFFVSEPEPSSLRPSQQEQRSTAPVTPTADVFVPAAPAAPVVEESAPAPEAPPPRPEKAPSSAKSLYPTPAQIYRKPPELCGESTEEDDTAPAFDAGSGASRRKPAGVAVLGVLVVALGVVFWPRSKQEPAPPAPRTSPAPAAVVPAPAAVAPAPATEQAAGKLPGFVPKVPADAGYAASHPGWELYRADGKQFRIYREQGKIRAIQVVADGEASLHESVMGSYFKEATGTDLPGKGATREQDGLAIETRKIKDGAEIAIYREKANRRIRGLVLQLPEKGHQ
ncbi:hypothetical protein KP004_02775 [Geomonas oryzisoli]|uniref:Uncharacterized protein n=1 Tax=Geomonas oryzisoli TaxID=2847992 RepID=A0ABX8J7X6_9BACT|nr:hypothetical protein [Geomonas oryzisoli]QWV94131.1 hypothetical protein KP004_02775 [Geomonas oryzisoli]